MRANDTQVESGEIVPTDIASKARREIMALSAGGEIAAVVPRTLEEAFRMAQMIVGAGLAPDSYDTNGSPDPQKIVIGILTALEIGVPPLTGLKGIAIINKRPCIWGDLAIALVQSKNLLAKMEHHYTGTDGQDDFTCHVVMHRRGQESPYDAHFSIADAKRAQLWGNHKKRPWIEYPKRMLFNRARAFALRDGFADCLSGLAIAEEARDLPEAPATVDTGFLENVPAKENAP